MHSQRFFPLGTGLLLAATLFALKTYGGPPFLTDDPEPVDYQHWEFYVASIDSKTAGDWSGTAPHVELNYGVVPNVQLHLITPLAYDAPAGDHSHYGYGDTELGVKFRFLQESDKLPQAGIFPLVELPSGRAADGLGNGRAQLFLPLWLQKAGARGPPMAAAATVSMPGPATKTGTLWAPFCKNKCSPTPSSARKSTIKPPNRSAVATTPPLISAPSLTLPNNTTCCSPSAAPLTAPWIFNATLPGSSRSITACSTSGTNFSRGCFSAVFPASHPLPLLSAHLRVLGDSAFITFPIRVYLCPFVVKKKARIAPRLK